jgi:hypothetical protein
MNATQHKQQNQHVKKRVDNTYGHLNAFKSKTSHKQLINPTMQIPTTGANRLKKENTSVTAAVIKADHNIHLTSQV